MPNIFLVQWDKAGAAERTRALRREGWTVTAETEDGGRAYKKIREDPPDVVVIDLAKKPSHGRQVAQALRDVKASRGIPIVFVDASDEAQRATSVDDAVFTTSATLAQIIARVSRRADSGPAGTPRRRRS
jgi:CheY-like chemotaxis protein